MTDPRSGEPAKPAAPAAGALGDLEPLPARGTGEFLARYAAEQDSLWGERTSDICEVTALR
jgi:hypothetical protein